MIKIFTLPQTYDKAKVVIDDNGVYTLLSYNTPIIEQYPDGTLKRLYDGWTATTGRHIKAFCELDKKKFMALPLNERI